MDTPVEQIPAVVERLRATYDRGTTRPLAWRRRQLRQLQLLLEREEDRILAAMGEDMRKPPLEAWVSELQIVSAEIAHTLRHLKAWSRPERVHTTLVNQPGSAWVERQPLGVVLVIGPWNYPWQLVVLPAMSALAAGNTVVIKPSELAPASARLLGDLIPRYLDPDAVQVVQGDVPAATALLEERFDHILFTGGGRVGRIVMAAAAKNLTPVTLELGGKSPAIVDRSANLDVTARRLAWGKFFNAGQTCIAPDYVLAHREVYEPLLDLLAQELSSFYRGDPRSSPDLARIVSDEHFDRLSAYLDDGEATVGGETDRAERYIAPTVLTGVSPQSPVMQEEIFGPILPVLPVDDLDAAVRFVSGRDKPLALYVFAESRAAADQVLASTSSGGACVNDVITHLTLPELPFGGVGESGMGAYHGRQGFETFSHRRSVLRKSTRLDPAFRYPPYSPAAFRWLKRLL